nr:MAG TPA: hypothetical protein [Caudoviricetes sp.]
MLKHEGRNAQYCGGIEHHVTCEGLPLTGKNLFRNVLAQQLFDRLRSQADISDYGRMSNDKNVFYFAFLNGEIKYYTRREILSLAKKEEG